MKLRLTKKWRRRLLKYAGELFILFVVSFIILWFAFPFPKEEFVRDRGGLIVCDREGNILRVYLNEREDYCFPVKLSQMNPYLASATIAVEDKRFRSHHGFDPLAVSRAMWNNITKWRRTSGASTLTMQTIRLTWPRERTFKAKVIETFRALQVETRLSKDEILEYYLNYAPYGSNIYGVEAASLRYFGKPSCALTLSEAAVLAGLPASPSRFRPDKYPGRARERRDYVLKRMYDEDLITQSEFAEARNEPIVPDKKVVSPFVAPHFCELVKGSVEGTSSARVITTLNRQIQRSAENALTFAVDVLKAKGVSNGAVVVIENKTGAVRALVGSYDFFDVAHSGQVNGALASRSPGSALKPFTYALAFDKSLCLPDEILPDVPTPYRDYDPENYEHRFEGMVSAREALTSSLNLPALHLLTRVGGKELYQLLKATGFSNLTKSADYYGLGLTLGSAEVNLLDITNAYASLARLGEYQPYCLLDSEIMKGVQQQRWVISPEAAYLIADILSDPQRIIPLPGYDLVKPNIPVVSTSSYRLPRIAWKTGTSSGHRDAWTIGYTPEYTVGVWLGNFSSQPSRGLVAVNSAAPAVFEIFKQIYDGKPVTWFEPPSGFGAKPVCVRSGMLAGKDCPQVESRLVIAKERYKTCTVHQRLMVDDGTGNRLCYNCMSGRKYHYKVFEVWSPEINSWLAKSGQFTGVPAHFSACLTVKDNGGLHIISPPNKQKYSLINDNMLSAQQLKLQVVAASGVNDIFWFIDGCFYRQAGVSERLFWPLQPGRHTITCVDNEGRNNSVAISVEE
ncbi:MAG: penicillin-binding protein 1C [Planctomycetes bacterium]|nr:penicillin-binding protein 1C [Planctomycetota bacterium]